MGSEKGKYVRDVNEHRTKKEEGKIVEKLNKDKAKKKNKTNGKRINEINMQCITATELKKWRRK